MAQLAVAGVRLDAEIDVAVVCHIGVTALDQILDDTDDLADMLGGAGRTVGS